MVAMSAQYMRQYRARRAVNRGGLLPFQKAFVEAICRKENAPAIAAASWPRGSGKSWLCGQLIARSITPGDVLHEDAVENILVSSSRDQAKIVLEFARQSLGDTSGFRWSDTGVIHKASRARVRIISSDSRRALGLGAHVRLIVCDEPAAWAPTAGKRLWDAMATSLGKRQTQILAVGTLAPAPLTGPGAWWPDFIKQKSGDGRHIAVLAADPDKWRDFDEVLACQSGGRDQSASAKKHSNANIVLRLIVIERRGPSNNSGSTFPVIRWIRNR